MLLSSAFCCKQTALKIEDGDEQLSSIKDTSSIRYLMSDTVVNIG